MTQMLTAIKMAQIHKTKDKILTKTKGQQDQKMKN